MKKKDKIVKMIKIDSLNGLYVLTERRNIYWYRWTDEEWFKIELPKELT